MRLSKRLRKDELYRLSETVARHNHLKGLSSDALNVAYETDEILITCNDNGVMWVNRDFIAYAPEHHGVRYAYMTKRYIVSQRRSFRINSILQKKRERMPEDIMEAFLHAGMCMEKENKDIWIDENYMLDSKGGT